jgi:hypothetical protein
LFGEFLIIISRSAEEDPDKKDDKTKKPWKEGGGDKWSHDKFNESDQAPKSRDELVTSYGYDIRSEEGPPRARRRRRYGYNFCLPSKLQIIRLCKILTIVIISVLH